MILKPWAEVPTPRHLLDDNDELEGSEAEALLSSQPWTTVEKVANYDSVDQLIFIAPRLSIYGEHLAKLGNDGNVIKAASIKSGITINNAKNVEESSIKQPPPGELYEFNEEDITSTTNSPRNGSKTLYENDVYIIPQIKSLIITVPPLSPSHCYEYASQVLNTFTTTSKAIILTPGNMVSTSGNVYKLTTSNVDSTALKEIPYLEPPFIISGAPAAILTRLENNSIPSIALIVKAEGPQGFEAIDYNSTNEDIERALELSLNLPTNTLRVPSQSNVDRGLYI